MLQHSTDTLAMLHRNIVECCDSTLGGDDGCYDTLDNSGSTRRQWQMLQCCAWQRWRMLRRSTRFRPQMLQRGYWTGWEAVVAAHALIAVLMADRDLCGRKEMMSGSHARVIKR